MTDIQKARDVLAKWRDSEPLDIATFGPLDEPLIVGTAGNPDLLDAIDAVLANWKTRSNPPTLIANIAAAIVAADERLSA